MPGIVRLEALEEDPCESVLPFQGNLALGAQECCPYMPRIFSRPILEN